MYKVGLEIKSFGASTGVGELAALVDDELLPLVFVIISRLCIPAARQSSLYLPSRSEAAPLFVHLCCAWKLKWAWEKLASSHKLARPSRLLGNLRCSSLIRQFDCAGSIPIESVLKLGVES